MSSILDKGNNKTKCQKFTSDKLLNTMLDLVNYNTNIIGKTILENSFGSGNILKAIVLRYINYGIKQGIDKSEISKGLERDIYGIELDSKLYNNCIDDLNGILKSYNIPAVSWNLFNDNALSLNLNVKFDFVIGNPPYISYKEMDNDSRINLRTQFESCSIGKFDYCYAFIELGIRYLKNNGKLVQLIPNNIYKNVYAKKLRDILSDHISIIYDYPNQKLFEKTLTSVSIFLYDKENNRDDIYYKNITTNKQRILNRKSLGDKWLFSNNVLPNTKLLRFGDIFNASVTIATLYNKAYIVDQKSVEKENLEKDILRNAVSPKSLRYNKNKIIIFPYMYNDNRLFRYSTEDFETLYPNIVRHLKKHTKELKLRNSDKNIAWFEYGRSQALAHLNHEKLLISTIITNQIDVYKVDADTIPFSGIYITIKNQNYTLDDAVSILKSNHFMEYVKNIGININGKSLRITCKDINNYMFLGDQINGKTTIYN